MIGRDILFEEVASANYVVRQVRCRRTGDTSWEVAAAEGPTVASGLADREEALRFIRGWEALSRRLKGGLPGHKLFH
jgi:hypothetical protein